MPEKPTDGIAPASGVVVDPNHRSASADGAENSAVVRPARFAETFPPVALMLLTILMMTIILTALNTGRCGDNVSSTTEGYPEIAALKTQVAARRAQLNRQRTTLGLPPLEGEAEPIMDIAARLKDDTDSLVNVVFSYQQALRDKDSEISERSSELLELEERLKTISLENSRLREETIQAASETSRYREIADGMKTELDEIFRKLAEVRAHLSEAERSVSSEDYADLQRRYDETLRAKVFFENRAKEWEASVAKPKVFAQSEEELLPDTVDLFRSLRNLEGVKESDLNEEYARLSKDLGAIVVHTLDFGTGSGELSPEEIQQLSQIRDAQLRDDATMLIVGYASKKGDPAENARLSSARATALAEHLATKENGGRLVQAVFLGQTDRFGNSAPIHNQLCEIWKIGRR